MHCCVIIQVHIIRIPICNNPSMRLKFTDNSWDEAQLRRVSTFVTPSRPHIDCCYYKCVLGLTLTTYKDFNRKSFASKSPFYIFNNTLYSDFIIPIVTQLSKICNYIHDCYQLNTEWTKLLYETVKQILSLLSTFRIILKQSLMQWWRTFLYHWGKPYLWIPIHLPKKS